MRPSFKIAGLGEVLWDLYEDEKFLGGAPANFAAHVNQAGEYGIILSRIGNDKLGDQLMHELISRNLDVSGIQIDPVKSTGTVRVHLDEAGLPSFDCTHDVAFDFMSFNDLWYPFAKQVDAVLFGTLAQRNAVSKKAIHDFLNHTPHAIKIFDINLRGWSATTEKIVMDSCALANIIKLNQAELAQLKAAWPGPDDDGEYLQEFLGRFDIELAALTLGENGSLLVSGKEVVDHPGFSVRTIDTTGAGDAFAAGMVIKYLEKAPLIDIADFSNRLGAFVTTRKGAVPEWTFEEIMDF
jgi:fructokinase